MTDTTPAPWAGPANLHPERPGEESPDRAAEDPDESDPLGDSLTEDDYQPL